MDNCCCICISFDHIRHSQRTRAALASLDLHTTLFHQRGSDQTPREIFHRLVEPLRLESTFPDCTRKCDRLGIARACFCNATTGLRGVLALSKEGEETEKEILVLHTIVVVKTKCQFRECKSRHFIMQSETSAKRKQSFQADVKKTLL